MFPLMYISDSARVFSTSLFFYSKNAKDKLYPASITKIMTALLACEYLDMNDTITMSQEAAYGIESEAPAFTQKQERFSQ